MKQTQGSQDEHPAPSCPQYTVTQKREGGAEWADPSPIAYVCVTDLH